MSGHPILDDSGQRESVIHALARAHIGAPSDWADSGLLLIGADWLNQVNQFKSLIFKTLFFDMDASRMQT